MPEQPQTNHHNTQVDELLSRPPSWLLRWGSTVALFALFTLFAIAWFVRYPDVVTGTANISQVNPPQVLQARQNGRMAQLLVADGANVQKGSVLAVLKNAAQLSDVQEIDSLATILSANLLVGDTLLEPILWPVKALGELQNSYTALQASYTDYAQFLHQRAYQQKIAAMQSQLAMCHQFYQRSWQQRVVLQSQFDLAQARFVSDSILGLEGVYAKQDVSQRKENMLQLEYGLHGARAALAQTQIQVAELEKNIADLQLEFTREKTNKRQAAEQSLKALQNGINNWFLQNAFMAEIAGVVNYQTLWAKNQKVLGGQHVFTIIPKQKSETKAVVLVAPARASKITAGERVQIKLDAYPYEEYGMLVGTVAKMNSSPTTLADGTLAYVVEVGFTLPLETSYGKSIADLAEQSGTAEIITEELSLLERIFYSLRKIFVG